MSWITIHLDNLTDVDLRQWCQSTADALYPRDPHPKVDTAEAIRALTHVTLHDPGLRSRVSKHLQLHPGGETMMNPITVFLGNQTDLELSMWHPEVDADKAIQAMIHVMLNDKSIGDQVMRRLQAVRPVAPAAPLVAARPKPNPQDEEPNPAKLVAATPADPNKPISSQSTSPSSPGSDPVPREREGPRPF